MIINNPAACDLWELDDFIYESCINAVQEAIDTNCNKFGIVNAILRTLRDCDSIIADHEPRIMAEYKDINEIMVHEADGVINRYKKVVV